MFFFFKSPRRQWIQTHPSPCNTNTYSWYFVCTFESEALFHDSWFAEYYSSLGYVPSDIPMSSRYLTSVYWSITALTGVGFGDIVAKSDRERAYPAVVMLAVGFDVGCD